MRTVCALRRSWFQLRTVSLPILGSNCRSPCSVSVSNLGKRCFRNSACSPSACCPVRSSGQTFLPTIEICSWYRTSFHRGRNSASIPSLVPRDAKLFGPRFSENGLAFLVASPVRCNMNEKQVFDDHPENERPSRGKLLDYNILSSRSWELSKGANNFVILPLPGDDDKEDTKKWAEHGIHDGNVTFGQRITNLVPSSLTRRVLLAERLNNVVLLTNKRLYSSGGTVAPPSEASGEVVKKKSHADYSQRAVVTALWCNFLVFSLKLGVWTMTSSHVMLAESIHSLADLANQALIAYGLVSSRRAPDALHPYGYSKERFVWSLISAVGIFCLGSGATIVHGVQNLWNAQQLENTYLAALVLGGSMIMEGASLLVAISCVRNGAREEGMTLKDYLWRGHDPTTVAVMMEDGAAVTGLAIAGLALLAVHYTGNPIWDPIGSIVVGNLLGAVAIFLIQRNRDALLGRSMDETDMMRVISVLSKDAVVDAIYDCKSEMIGPGSYRFKAEIDFNGTAIVQNYIRRAGRGTWQKEFQDAASSPEAGHLDRVMAAYGEEVVSALGSEVDRLEREIQKVIPGIRHVDIEAHNPYGPTPREKFYLKLTSTDETRGR